jgi:hypothetical protein
MKTKRKIIAIFVILLMLAIPVSVAQAVETSENEEKIENITVELTAIDSDGSLITENLQISEEDLVKLESAISEIMDEIQSMNDLDNNVIRNLIEKIFRNDDSRLGRVLGKLTRLKLTRKRGFVISSGHGIDYSPMKKISFKISKKAAVWHYNSKGMIKDRTIILKPLALNMKILKGIQFGVMTGFIGIYLSVSRGFLRNSYTMFMGTARHINGIQLSPNI